MATKDVDLVTNQLSQNHISASPVPPQKEYASRKKDTDYERQKSLNDKSFEEAKETLIGLVNEILKTELQSYFYIGKAYIAEKVLKEFDIKNHHTWEKTGISNAFKGTKDKTKMKCSEDFDQQVMFILAAIDETVIRSADIEVHCAQLEVMTPARFVELYTTSLEGALITHYLLGAGDRPKEIANISNAAGNSTDRGRFVLYMRVAKPNL